MEINRKRCASLILVFIIIIISSAVRHSSCRRGQPRTQSSTLSHIPNPNSPHLKLFGLFLQFSFYYKFRPPTLQGTGCSFEVYLLVQLASLSSNLKKGGFWNSKNKNSQAVWVCFKTLQSFAFRGCLHQGHGHGH